MINAFKKLLCMAAAGGLLAGNIIAAEEKSEEKSDLEKLKDKYEFTENVKSCINIRRVRNTKVVDGKNILFQMSGKKYFLNEMSRKCPRLAAEERFMYKLHSSRLCHVDTITVLDSFGRDWASCGLGKFREVVKKEKKEDASKD